MRNKEENREERKEEEKEEGRISGLLYSPLTQEQNNFATQVFELELVTLPLNTPELR